YFYFSHLFPYLLYRRISSLLSFFSLHASSPPSNYTLSLHDALPIFISCKFFQSHIIDRYSSNIIIFNHLDDHYYFYNFHQYNIIDRKSTRLNSSHVSISYAVFCLKKKKKKCKLPIISNITNKRITYY